MKKFIALHKIFTTVVAIVLVGGGYYMYQRIHNASAEPRYVFAEAAKGTLVSSVAASGEVASLDQIDMKPKVSGDIISLPVAAGDHVKAGQLLIALDDSDAQKTVRDAATNLETARLALDKLQQPPDALSLMQSKNSVTSANESLQNANDDLTQDYSSGFNAVASTFNDLPGVMTGMNTLLNGNAVSPNQNNLAAYYDMIKAYEPNAAVFENSAATSYQDARIAYDKNLNDYKNTSRYADRATIDALIAETYTTTQKIAEAIKNAKSYLDLVNDTLTSHFQNASPPAIITTHENLLKSYTSTVNSNVSSLLSTVNSIQNDKDSIVSSQRSIDVASASLAKLVSGPDPLDVRSQQLSVDQKKNALTDAQNALMDYTIRAPFDGIIAKLSVKKRDTVSGGAAVMTLVTTQKIATVTLNEVDIAKVHLNQKTTLTFDAVPDLTIAGTVASIDTIGTVSQGVVTYNVQIAFETQDDRVKPGMSVSSAIVTQVDADMLLIPGSAVKTQGGAHYIETIPGIAASSAGALTSQGITSNVMPTRVAVETGNSNDTSIAITSGLKEGDLVITRTITGTATTPAATPAAGGLRIPGVGGGGGFIGR
ncbi:MAG: HlyD family efflux transporter periplasmic adaptor subunit [bacterium]|nr:HlyD family efflux transporter periplasmic adaptor subunit [bacterium]